jgi:DNA-binding NtrC family response regulator
MSAAPLPPPGGGETILVVDDDASLRQLVTSVLTRRRYNVLSADSAEAALGLWSQHDGTVDLLLTDVVMPGGLSGAELAERLMRERPSLRILYMSGYAVMGLAREIGNPDQCRLLRKPFTIEDLIQTVRAHLDGAKTG